MKSLMLLWQRTAADAAVQCCTSALQDLKRVEERFKDEGIGLLTLYLPEVGKAFERSLDQGKVTDDLLSLCGKQAGFPVFLRNFLLLVFERNGGLLLDDPSPDAIQAVRQLTLMFSKVSLPCTSAREGRAFDDYVECEQEVRSKRFDPGLENLKSFERIASVLFGKVFSKIDRKVFDGDVIPKHGPGVTADRLLGNKKYRQSEWTDRLESVFPAMENLIPSFRYHRSLDELNYLDPGSERPVKVISVPKTLKTPRIIAIEPTCMQYMQQGLMELMVKYLESDNLVQDMIGFTDQAPNQRMACEGSLSGELATLDLSEASDRVSSWHVYWLCNRWDWLFQSVMATRSNSADVPGHGVVPLAKFASMGSALTFPMEECVFLTCIFYAVEQVLGRRLTGENDPVFRELAGKVRVYGDDIIVPVELVRPTISALELFGFKVNRSKSFWTGKFRESCGKEYYAGHDVSIFRVRRCIPSWLADAPGVVSTVSLRNHAYKHGYWGTAKHLDSILKKILNGFFPRVGPDSPVLGRHSVLGYDQEYECPDLQIPLVKGYRVRTRIPHSHVEDEYALLKCLLHRGIEPLELGHLERQGRPLVVSIKLGKSRAY